MQQKWDGRVRPELKQIVAEATMALARLDGDRLEELALSCEALNRELSGTGLQDRAALAQEAGGAVKGMAVFSRVLEVTRSNERLMRRLLELRAGRPDYGPGQGDTWMMLESRNGDH